MNLISIGSIDQKYKAYFMLYILFGLSVNELFVVINQLINKENKENEKVNIALNIIIRNAFCIFFIIPEIINNKKDLNQKIEFKSNEKDENEIVYIYRKPQREITIKNLIILILLEIFQYIYNFASISYEIKLKDHFKLYSIDGYISLDILYLLLIYKISNKVNFYRHQYLSLVIMAAMGLVRYLIRIFYLNEVDFQYPNDLFCLIPIIIFPFLESLYYYIIKIFMKYKYFSPCFITVIQGTINTFISLIIFIISLYSKNTIYKSLLDRISIPNAYVVIFSIIISIFNGFVIYLVFKTIYDFSIFYLIFILGCRNFLSIVNDFNLAKLSGWIVIIFVFVCEIFAMLVFIEIVELNFLGLNINLKKNIILRERNEFHSIYKIEDEDHSNESESSLNKELDENGDGDGDDDSIY